jgi:hypothetical protein
MADVWPVKRLILVTAALVLIAAAAVGVIAWRSVDVREMGRSDPKRAANYRLPWSNFSETYTDGTALGVKVGSTKGETIKAAEGGRFVVEPSCWDDGRAGGASLYERSVLLATMLRQSTLCFSDSRDLRRGMIIRFRADRVASINVYYINSEAL